MRLIISIIFLITLVLGSSDSAVESAFLNQANSQISSACESLDSNLLVDAQDAHCEDQDCDHGPIDCRIHCHAGACYTLVNQVSIELMSLETPSLSLFIERLSSLFSPSGIYRPPIA